LNQSRLPSDSTNSRKIFWTEGMKLHGHDNFLVFRHFLEANEEKIGKKQERVGRNLLAIGASSLGRWTKYNENVFIFGCALKLKKTLLANLFWNAIRMEGEAALGTRFFRGK
jgi:hypothetical protein